MKRFAVGIATAVLLSSPVAAAAQVTPADFIRPDSTELDSLSQSYKDALLLLRDTLTTVQASVSSFRRVLAQGGAETVVNRARSLHAKCGRAVVTVREMEPTFSASRAPDDRVREQSVELTRQMRTLRGDLDENCGALAPEGPGERADTLRAWGPYYSSRIDRALVAYYESVARFLKAADFKLEPPTPS